MGFELKEGSIVQLKSGGPLMTVVRLRDANANGLDYDVVDVIWFDKSERLGGAFAVHSVVEIEPEKEKS